MAATVEFDSQDEIREGFLCPVCHVDLGTIYQLQTHYEETHSSEDKATFNSIKELLSRAKRKILKEDGDDSTSPDESSFTGLDPSLWDYQEIGITSSHTEYFKRIRNSRTDRYVLETNKLLIRLDKLLTDSPLDPVKRKAHEKLIVMWAPDQDVPLCPTCTKHFNLMRRKHHCRLCGSIMCANCSQFITHEFARKLTNNGVRELQESSSNFAAEIRTPASSPVLSIPRSGSSTSLNSIMNAAGEPHIRVCEQCKKLLDRRDEVLQQQHSRPAIVHLYETLKTSLDEATHLCPIYLNMINSLVIGETKYALKDAQELRTKLTRLAEKIDLYSKKVMVLEIKEEAGQSPKNLKLHRGIYLSAHSFLQDRMLGLPSVPSEEDVCKVREQRKRELELRIAHEKRMALEFQNQVAQQNRETSPRKEQPSTRNAGTGETEVVSTELGWGPETLNSARAMDNDDPIIQQMNIIRNYIKQAKKAYKFDEAHMLEENLKELQEEYWRQREAGAVK